MPAQLETGPGELTTEVRIDRAPAGISAWLRPVLGLLLFVGTLLLYSPVASHPFINYDDHQYVIDNAHVTSGLTVENIAWAWTAGYAANWHPLTWISHQLDAQLFGLNAGPQHLVNAGLHAANAWLLFLVLLRMTAAPWRSFLAAALFAWHPTHVESVAWISERKDVLSTFFWMLALLAYGRFAARRTWSNYALVALAQALGLMCKPMVVTLPCVLLLLDYWPLNRLTTRTQWWRLVGEKIPLLALSAAACVITFMVQRTGGAVVSLEQTPLLTRLATALLTTFFYLGKIFWPTELFLPYWYEFKADLWPMVAAVAGFAGLTIGCLWWGNRARYLPVGWFWFLGTLVPVIGLVQVGSQSAADRYTYIPSIGIFIVVAWGAADLALRWKIPRAVIGMAGGVLLAGCVALTARQIGYWKNSVVLFQHTLAIDPPNLVAVNLLAWTFATDLDPTLRDGEKAVELASFCVQVTQGREPVFLKALAAAYAESHQFPLAIQTVEEAIRLATAAGQTQLVVDIQANLDQYRAGRAIHQK